MNRIIEKYYRIADVGLKLSLPQKWDSRQDDILEEYVSWDKDYDYWVNVEAVEQLSAPKAPLIYSEPSIVVYGTDGENIRYDGFVNDGWENAYIRMAQSGNQSHVQLKQDMVKQGLGSRKLTEMMNLEHVLALHDSVILHAAFIEHRGKAILFTAPSGTGKSTQAELWEKYCGAELVNGDRAVIRIHPDGLYAWGAPLSGMSPIHKNRKLPLAAIVYLGQAEKNSIQKLRGAKAFRHIWEGCGINVWNKDDLLACSRVVTEIASNIPVFYLECVPDYSAVKMLHDELEKVNVL